MKTNKLSMRNNMEDNIWLNFGMTLFLPSGVATDFFCTGVISHPGDIIRLRNWFEKLKSGSVVTCEEGLAPLQRPFKNDTK